MKWLLFVFLGLAAVVLLVVLIGFLLPKAHVATRQVRLHRQPEEVWKVITDIEATPRWRTGLKSIKRLPDHNGLPAWVESVSRAGEIPLETVVSQPPKKLVT